MTGAMLLDYAAKGAFLLALLAAALGGFFIGRRRREADRQASDAEADDAERRRAAEQDRDAMQAVLNYDEYTAYGYTPTQSGTGNTSG